MAGTDNTVADDDALYVLTAVLLTPAQFPSVLGDDYPAACAALGLEPYAEGYGLVMGQDSDGARWTVVVDDVSLVAVAIASWDCGMEYDLSPDDRSVVSALPGWPLALAVAAPGVPAPHDPAPDPEADGEDLPPLAPPATDVWGPAQRRLGADAIALQWAVWREQIDDATAFAPAGGGGAGDENAEENDGPGAESSAGVTAVADGAGATGDSGAGEDAESRSEDLEPESRSEDVDGESGSPEPDDDASGTHPGIRRALAEAHAYVDAPPPPGRVRSSFAPGDARMIRADGPGWSMVARTDDIAFMLLDEVPGEILPVGRGTELPKLLEALDALAVRPS
ncbi:MULTISPECIES: hypothetical protein [unclassified Streptomyces]|uniref:hypothetical protein n=1 Tax=unclassified Streptomyces TaxID=2593676 RepID=UPI002DDC2151|nr:hypothetical protein [Streptomyces sp. NBC_01257]WRZ69406.1 hypothetical protein OG408_38325 [Streptomyces sp. NBC_01257]WSU63341.1 hypothetical protein OG450_38190 [Streptomyces sp. NBC_01104]